MSAIRDQLYKYKGERCAYCKKTIKEVRKEYGTIGNVFHFNHIDPSKKAGKDQNPANKAKKDQKYKNLIRRKICTDVLDEVDKCVLLCSFCHGILHGQNLTGSIVVALKVDGKTFEQELKGVFVYSKTKRNLSFFTDEKILIFPYWVQVGGGARKLMKGEDLKTSFVEMSNTLAAGESLTINSYNSRFLASITRLENGLFNMKQCIRFPLLLEVESNVNDGKQTVWVRNGFALLATGEVQTEGELELEGLDLSKPVATGEQVNCE